MLSRREVLGAGLGLAASALGPKLVGAASDTGVSLRELGRSKGIDIGTAYSGTGVEKYRNLVAHHCELIVSENFMKPRALRAAVSTGYTFGPADRVAEFAALNGQKLHGHTLYWHEDPIRWAESDDYETVKQLYGGFIRDVVGRYNQAVSWDVFNEIVEEKRILRDEFLLRKFGYQFIDYCFRVANEAAPHARLVINDFNVECSTSWCGQKRANMLNFLNKLKSMKTPVHVVGIQSHLSSKYTPNPKATLQFIRRVADLGFDVYLSELDVNDSQFAADIEKRDRQVAQYYESYLTTVLAHKAVKRVNFWGISDYDNWVERGQTKEKRKSGGARPALFDTQNDPKPAFDAVVRALESAPVRT
jgi:endo-1,4-beta-xylanase